MHEVAELRQVLLAMIVVVAQAAKVAGLVILLQAGLSWQRRRCLLSSVIDCSNEATSSRWWSFGSRSTANDTQ